MVFRKGQGPLLASSSWVPDESCSCCTPSMQRTATGSGSLRAEALNHMRASRTRPVENCVKRPAWMFMLVPGFGRDDTLIHGTAAGLTSTNDSLSQRRTTIGYAPSAETAT